MKTSQCTDPNRHVALFQGSFDPFTRGHESIVRRALPLFDEVVIAVVNNKAKTPLMPLDKRMEYIRQVFAGEARVRVVVSEGLTVDVAHNEGATCLLRGVRTVQDYESEMIMAQANRDLGGIETVILFALPELAHVSSSLVRELHSYGRDVSQYLPLSYEL